MLFLDLDRFKVVNDSLGHQVGDQLLQAVALRLDAALRPGDTVARMGGDEFTVLLEDVADAREATVVAERVLATLADPFDIAGRELFVSSSIGIALGGPDAEPEGLIRDADVAMYRAKAQGKARHAVFDAQMHRRVLARLDLETDLRRAIEAGSLQVLFQPILRAATGELTAFEALCRWDVDTADFVAIAEETGLIVPLGRFVLREAARRAAEWGACVSVNVSARQLADPDFTAGVEAALRASGAQPGRAPARGHRVGDDAGPRARAAHADRPARPRRRERPPRRLRHGRVVAALPAPVPRRRAEDRPRARDRHAHRRGLARDRQGDRRPRAQPRHGGRRRGRRDRRAPGAPAQALGVELAQGFHLAAPLTAEAAGHLLAPRAPPSRARRRASPPS